MISTSVMPRRRRFFDRALSGCVRIWSFRFQA
jgi:hypothetical protein